MLWLPPGYGLEARYGHIIRYGSNATRQEAVYRQRRLDGASHDAALKAVVDSVIDETEWQSGALGH